MIYVEIARGCQYNNGYSSELYYAIHMSSYYGMNIKAWRHANRLFTRYVCKRMHGKVNVFLRGKSNGIKQQTTIYSTGDAIGTGLPATMLTIPALYYIPGNLGLKRTILPSPTPLI